MTQAKGPVGGLRERKKQRTRDALVRAAIELFVAKGYEATTVDEIAAAVDVSQRTFFRYFAGKEEAALALEDSARAGLIEAVAARPAAESPYEALRGALSGSWADITSVIAEAAVPAHVRMRMHRLIESTPSLLAAQMRRSAMTEERLVTEIARREGLDPLTDPRPRVLVAAFYGVVRSAARLWSTGGDLTVESLRQLSEHHLDLLVPAITTPWRGPARTTEEKTTSNVT